MKPQGFVPPSSPSPDHEAADLNVSLIVRNGVILGSVLIALLVAVGALFHYFNHVCTHRTSQAEPVVTTSDLPPTPRLQTDPAGDLQVVRDSEDAHLNHYAWIDRAQGIAQVPIERAMVLWVKTYVPAPAAAAVPTTNAPAASTELQMRQNKAKEIPHAL